MSKFSSSNPISLEMIVPFANEDRLCAGAFGTQSDCQCLGYDRLCALANLFYIKGERDASDNAIKAAKAEISKSKYSHGFQEAWDGKSSLNLKQELENYEFALGFANGKEIRNKFKWISSRPNDVFWR